MHVFLSYRTEDTLNEAMEVTRYLQKLNIGLEVFEYRAQTRAGDRWEPTIDANLERSEVLIALMGNKWLRLLQAKNPEADKVRDEITTAMRRGMRVIQLVMGNEPVPEPSQLKDLSALSELYAMRCKQLNPEILRQLAEQIRGEKNWNWIIVSDRSAFGKALRTALMKKRRDLDILRHPDFKAPAAEHKHEYARLLSAFRHEAPHGSWLFTNYAEDEKNPHPEPEDMELIEDLVRQRKRMICFESGHNLQKRANNWREHQDFPDKDYNPVGVIQTPADQAISDLIKHMADHVWRKHQELEVVSIMGPRAGNMDERGRKYFEFFGCLQHGLDADASYKAVCTQIGTYGTKVLCTTVAKPLSTLVPKECREEIEHLLNLRKCTTGSVHTTFVCGNDDVARYVYDSLELMSAAPADAGGPSFVGFDGMPNMKYLKKKVGERAVTANVNFGQMAWVASKWVHDGEVPRTPFSVLAVVR